MNQVKTLFKDNDVDFIVYGKVFCKYCKKSKKLLNERNAKFLYINLDEIDILGEFLEELKKEFKFKTIPVIFKSGKYIGGYTELEHYYKSMDGV